MIEKREGEPFSFCLGNSISEEVMMVRKLLPLLLIVPAVEVMILIYSSHLIGVMSTFLLIIATSFIGAFLAKKQGTSLFQKAQRQMSQGHVPSGEILDGMCVLFGGLFLLFPGFLTDVVGFIFLLPFTRRIVKPFLLTWLRRFFQGRNRMTIIR